MSADRRRFDSARRTYLDAKEDETQWRVNTLLRKYGSARPSESWLTHGERERIQRFRNRQDRASSALFDVLERVSPRSWTTHAPHWWVMESLTWEDATTSGALSVTPPPAYGYTARQLEHFAAALPAPVEA